MKNTVFDIYNYSKMNTIQIIQQILHYGTLPGAAGLFCILVFMLGKRRRGELMMLSLSAAVSLNLLLKELFKVPRPWLMHVETAPYLAEGGYALPCLHTMITAALLGAFALISNKKPLRFVCAFLIWLIGTVRVFSKLQSIPDVLSGAAAGLLIAFLLCKYTGFTGKFSPVPVLITAISGLAAAILFQDGWGLGLSLTVAFLRLLDKPFQKAESKRTTFGKVYGTIFAAGIYTGLIILLPFLIEWLITPFWPGQTLIVLLITLIPCLLRLIPIF